jgi:hypothetical protein
MTEYAVTSKNHETGEVSVDTYEDAEKAREMALMFKNDMPERDFYLGAKLSELIEDEEVAE